ncbi:MAG: hypothetical protein IKV48_01600, partial [Eggerthellaceae bacterium]|nr:hypothetical protein [Eggerthellaceae bacterium]
AEGAFYYQGDVSDVEVPWNVQVAYTLDGTAMTPDEVAGATGELAIHVTTTPNDEADASFAESYLLQITVTMNGDTTSSIRAEGATVASAGKNRTIAFTALPGVNADCLLVADVRDFEMAGIQIAALPYSMAMELPDIDGMLGGMTQLTDAIAQIDGGAAQLAEGVAAYADGSGEFAVGLGSFGDGLEALSGSSDQLVSGSAQIDQALAAIVAGFEGASDMEFDLQFLLQLLRLPDELRTLAASLDQLSGQASLLKANFDSAYAELGVAVASIPAATVGESDIEALVASTYGEDSGATALTATAQTLAEAYRAAQAVKSVYESADFQQAMLQTSAAFTTLGADAATPGSLAYLSAMLVGMADGLESTSLLDLLEGFEMLVDGLNQLSGNYGTFHAGLVQYTEGVGSLSQGFGGIEEGAVELADGAQQLSEGTDELASGIGMLADETANIPDVMREEIDAMMAEYSFPAWDPISFTAAENENTVAVQFVMMTAPIEVPDAPEADVADEGEMTIIDRFLALFGLR